MPLTMDLSQDGLHMFFKDYQVQSLRAIWSSEKGLNSRQVLEAVGEKNISRASRYLRRSSGRDWTASDKQ